MRTTTGIGVFVMIAAVLLLEFAGAGASLASSAQNDRSACFGYELCR